MDTVGDGVISREELVKAGRCRLTPGSNQVDPRFSPG